MQHQVLARKYRPRQFADVVGQNYIVQALSNTLSQQLLHHAYLFTGTHGTGKTTLARIFAKALNCEQGISATPCNTCNHCQEIDSGRFPDFFEVDAASRTKVEDTRELLDNVQYAPSKGRYKIYLIDEVHMLSGHSFNALLKTLEEPPEHVKFLLATTDPQKLPATILSRCLQFHLSQMPVEQISQHLAYILQQENVPFDESALPLIGKAADGSMRDALSLLDQCIAFGNNSVHEADVRALLGTIEPTALFEILHALSQRDGASVLQSIEKMQHDGIDFSQALADLLGLLHQVSVRQIVPDTAVASDHIATLAKALSAEDTQLFYQIGLLGQRDIHYAPNPKVGFEMTLLRMLAFYPSNENQSMVIQPKQHSAKPAASSNMPWHELLPQLNLSGMALALAKNCCLIEITEKNVLLSADAAQKPLAQAKQIERINQALTEHFKRPLKANIEFSAAKTTTPAEITEQQQQRKFESAKESIQTDPKVQQLMQTFDATLVEDSIKTLDNLT